MRRGVGSTGSPALMTFALSSRAQSSSRGPSPPVSRRAALTGGSHHACERCRRVQTVLDASLGVFQSSPLHRRQHRASTPGRSRSSVRPEGLSAVRSFGLAPRGPTSRAVAFGPELPASGLVPPLPFFPASTVCSARYLAGLLHPAADHGVRPVSGMCAVLFPLSLLDGLSEERPPERGTHERRSEHHHSRGAFTLRSVPLVGSCTASPRPFPSRRQAGSWRRFRPSTRDDSETIRDHATDLKAFFHRRVRCAPVTLPSTGRPMLPWASDPLKNRCLRLRGFLATWCGGTNHDRSRHWDSLLPGRPGSAESGEPDAKHAPTKPDLPSCARRGDRSHHDPLTRPTTHAPQRSAAAPLPKKQRCERGGTSSRPTDKRGFG
jgi:hypothetical protein